MLGRAGVDQVRDDKIEHSLEAKMPESLSALGRSPPHEAADEIEGHNPHPQCLVSPHMLALFTTTFHTADTWIREKA